MTHAATNHARDWRTLALVPGRRVLIEASAGTGKTWTIAALYLRLLLETPAGETPIGVRQILVATYTNAAAEELRERLRRRLTSARQQAEAATALAHATDDPFSEWLQQRWQRDPAQRQHDAGRLATALAEFDRAPVLTLHAACHRILREHPFEAQVPFDVAELVDGKALLDDISADLWRLVQQADAADMAAGADATALACLRTVRDTLARDTLREWIKTLLQPGAVVAEAPVEAAVPAVLPDEFEAMSTFATTPGYLKANSRLAAGWIGFTDWLCDPSVAPDAAWVGALAAVNNKTSPALMAHADNEHLHACITRTREVWVPYFRDLLARQPAIPPQQLLAVQAIARRLRAARLAARDVLGYDDLIQRVHGLLVAGDARAATLADALFAAWPVALVDEFQDTDAQQTAILDRIYRTDDGARGLLVMIGDPRQAIYGFRGGDLHTYLRAAAAAHECLHLDVNQRSVPALVEACNAFYAACSPAFNADPATVADADATADAAPSAGIAYRAVQASPRHAGDTLLLQGAPVATPLTLHLRTDAPRSSIRREYDALVATAEHIACVLSDGRHRLRIGGHERAVHAGDIAVLLPNHKHLQRLKALLDARGVAVASQSRQSVFATATAADLLCILHAAWHHDDRRALLAALGTRLWGWPQAALAEAAAGTAQGEAAVLAGWHALWRARGVNAVVLALAARIGQRLLTAADGERVLTDLRHLGEVLQARSIESAGPEALLAWLRDQHAEPTTADNDTARAAIEQRIESDQPRVQLLTLHASKGLEFNLVWLPLLWLPLREPGKGELVSLSDPADGTRWLRSDMQAGADARSAQQQEHLRLFYVALTRARHACHVFALDPARQKDGSNRNPVNALGTQRGALDVLLQHLLHRHEMAFAQLPGNRLPALAALAFTDHWPCGDVVRAPQATARSASSAGLRALPAAPTQPLPRRHSFTSLADADPQPWQADAPADDERSRTGDVLAAEAAVIAAGEGTRTPHPELDALAGVAGAEFGNALHTILERRALALPLTRQHALVREALLDSGMRLRAGEADTLVERVAQRLQAVLDAPLGSADGPRLGTLAAQQLRAEMSFDYLLDGASLHALAAACRAHGDALLVPAHGAALHGRMTGKLDLVFEHGGRVHVLDYKGNRSGTAAAQCIEDYQPAALDALMQARAYRFQALLYTVALERYLRQRQGDGYRRDRHLGDCWYVFLRAVGLPGVHDPRCGVWRHRFDDRLLDAAQECLAASTGASS